MKILAHGHYAEPVTDSLPALKTLVKEATGESVRRVGRFIQLALVGAGRCLHEHRLHGQTPAKDTAVYLSSAHGDMEITQEVLLQMIDHGLPPKPLSFINTVSNSACFYIAKQFNLHGRSQFVTRRYAPLESALQLAALDLQTRAITTALVGSVDICTEPLAAHRQRLGIPDDARIGESSHWFLLGHPEHPAPAIATIDAVLQLPDNEALQRWLSKQGLSKQGTGTQTLPMAGEAFHGSQCGASIERFLRERPSRTMLHIDRDSEGCFNIVQVSLA